MPLFSADPHFDARFLTIFAVLLEVSVLKAPLMFLKQIHTFGVLTSW